MPNKYQLTTEQRRAKKSLENALKKFDALGLSLMSVVSGCSASLHVLTPEAYNDYTAKQGDHAPQCLIVGECEVVKDFKTWDGEIVP